MARISIPPGEGEERQRMWQLRPPLGEAFEAFAGIDRENSILPVREREAARSRIAHINGCVPCSTARVVGMEVWGLDESFYDDLDDPKRRGRYTERETLAIEFAERFAHGTDNFDDLFWERLRAGYSDAEIVDLSVLCAKWLGLGRLTAVLDLQVSCPIPIAHREVSASTGA